MPNHSGGDERTVAFERVSTRAGIVRPPLVGVQWSQPKGYPWHQLRGSQPAQADRGAQEALRIDGVAVDARLVVQVRAGRAPGGAHLADDLADADGLSFRNVDDRQMAVARRQSVAVIDPDHLAVAAAPSGGDDLAGRGGAHRIADVAAEVEARVHGQRADERVHAHAEAGGGLDLARQRAADRHRNQRAVEMLDLRASDVDAIELALERAVLAVRRDRHERAAGRARRADIGHLADVEPEVAENPAHAPRLGVVALFQSVEQRGLARFD